MALQQHSDSQQDCRNPISLIQSAPTKLYGSENKLTYTLTTLNQADYIPEKYGGIPFETLSALFLHKPFTKGENKRIQCYEGSFFLNTEVRKKDSAMKAISSIT